MGFAEGRFAEWLKGARAGAEMSQADLAKALTERGVSAHATTIAKIEAGDRSVKLDEAVAICSVLGGSLGELFPASDPLGLDKRLSSLERAMYNLSAEVSDAAEGLRLASDDVLVGLLAGRSSHDDAHTLRVVANCAMKEADRLVHEAFELSSQARVSLDSIWLNDDELAERYPKQLERRLADPE